MVTEQQLLAKMDVPERTLALPDLFRHLLAFWQYTSLHKRKCDLNGKDIISVFSSSCPYPVWHKDDWIKKAQPPVGELDLSKPFWDQLWALFQRCPLPHNTGVGGENCEYTDDWWHSKKCYLCHSGLNCEDVYYSYRVVNCRNSFFCVFSNNCELSTDLTNCTHCYNVNYALDCSQCHDSAFLFDCKNCHDCLLCFNLRNKQYCIENVQYTKEAYEQKRSEYQLSSRKQYDAAKARFKYLVSTHAWWRAQHIDQTEDVVGDYLREVRDCSMGFFIDKGQDLLDCFRAFKLKDAISSVGCFDSQLVVGTVLASEGSYDVRYSVNLTNCKFMEYCLFCINCENCFACAGLVGKKYCIMNKEYSSEEYKVRVAEIKAELKKKGIYGQLFPAYFSPCAYEDSLASFYFPLSRSAQNELGFRLKVEEPMSRNDYLPKESVPDDALGVMSDIHKQTFFDDIAARPFMIQSFDLEHSKKQQVPLPNCFYARRINENFSWMFCDGSIRETVCAKTHQPIATTLPVSLEGRIVSELAYQQLVG